MCVSQQHFAFHALLECPPLFTVLSAEQFKVICPHTISAQCALHWRVQYCEMNLLTDMGADWFRALYLTIRMTHILSVHDGNITVRAWVCIFVLPVQELSLCGLGEATSWAPRSEVSIEAPQTASLLFQSASIHWLLCNVYMLHWYSRALPGEDSQEAYINTLAELLLTC